jgi:predicted DNA binding CopG/RHH family protein
MRKTIPRFKSDNKERAFWAKNDSSEYVDWNKSQRVIFPKLKPSVKTISIRLPEAMIEELRILANKRDVPYQSLLKVFLAERIEREFKIEKPELVKA